MGGGSGRTRGPADPILDGTPNTADAVLRIVPGSFAGNCEAMRWALGHER